MKLPINKRVYRDALRRTRIIRIISLLVGIIMTVNAVDFPGGDAIVSTGIVMMATQATGMLAFLLLGEMIIHGYRRKRKWDFFRTLPASKAEWYWTSLLAEMTNMVLYILVTEAAVVIASFRMERRSMDNLMPGKLRFYPSEHIHRVILLFVIGLVFLAVLSVIRELAHTPASYFVLLLGIVGGYWVILALVPGVVRSFSGNFVSVYMSLFYRMRLFHRLMSTESVSSVTDVLVTAYDTLAILVNLFLAVLLLLFGRRLSDRSRVEFIGAEYRNKPMFYVLTILLNLFPLLLITYIVVLGGEYKTNILLVPVLIGLIVYFLLRLFREKLSKKFLCCVGLSVILAGIISAATLLYARFGRTLPAREEVIAMRCDYYFPGMVSDKEIMDKLYSFLENEHDNPVTERDEYHEMKISLYTKSGCHQFYINRDITEATEFLPKRRIVPTGIFCSFGKKPKISSEFETYEEYEEFAALLPDWCKKELPVYYVNALGGLSKSGQTVTVGIIDYYRARFNVYMSMENSFEPHNSIECAFPPDTEAEVYYHEKVCRPQRKALAEAIRENPKAFLTVVFFKEEDTYDKKTYDERWLYTRFSVGGNIVNGTFQQKADNPAFPEEYLQTIYDLILGPEEPITAGMETAEAVVHLYEKSRAYVEDYPKASYTFFVPAEKLKEIMKFYGDIRAEENRQREEEWKKRQEESRQQETPQQEEEGEGS